jgi:CelD/BcsL family acetyltransferase involved in cellulose biosynthesis
MTSAVGARNAPARAPGAVELVADCSDDVEAYLGRCAALLDDNSSPFHSIGWLRAWYATLGQADGRKPLWVGVRDRATGRDLMLLPLSTRRKAGLSVVEFADAGVIDYNAPIVSRYWPGDAASAHRLWAQVRLALRGHDVLRIDKMLAHALDGAQPANPLKQALQTQVCEMYGNQIELHGSWEEWHRTLDKRVRKEFERCWRVFTRSEDARFEFIHDPDLALELFTSMEAQQSLRMRQTGGNYRLDEPAYSAFYRQALAAGLADGSVMLTVLRDGESLVAAHYGIANARRYIALRTSIGGDAWKSVTPGRLLFDRTIRHLRDESGLSYFDFGIGAYRHKETFGVTPITLYDACEALSWRGQVWASAWRLRRALKRQTWLRTAVRRMRGGGALPPPPEA